MHVVVAARHGAHDVVERGDDDDDARRDAEVMPGLGPVPLLQRKSAAESRWMRPVPPTIAQEREKGFRLRPFLQLTKMEGA